MDVYIKLQRRKMPRTLKNPGKLTGLEKLLVAATSRDLKAIKDACTLDEIMHAFEGVFVVHPDSREDPLGWRTPMMSKARELLHTTNVHAVEECGARLLGAALTTSKWTAGQELKMSTAGRLKMKQVLEWIGELGLLDDFLTLLVIYSRIADAENVDTSSPDGPSDVNSPVYKWLSMSRGEEDKGARSPIAFLTEVVTMVASVDAAAGAIVRNLRRRRILFPAAWPLSGAAPEPLAVVVRMSASTYGQSARSIVHATPPAIDDYAVALTRAIARVLFAPTSEEAMDRYFRRFAITGNAGQRNAIANRQDAARGNAAAQ
jgi:hypothetical protein